MEREMSQEEKELEADEKDVKLKGIKVRLQKSASENSSIAIGDWRIKYGADVAFLVKELELSWGGKDGLADSDVKPRSRSRKK